ncbi:MAG TPA: DinB family protein [Gemmatimonadaceae bacterium]|nr:DinB family protein [Gemmatimonadaceae bacterium]
MRDSRALADHLIRTIHGEMWHGPAVGELLIGVSPDAAAAHPVPGAHSIWELVLHMTVWAEIAGQRLAGLATKSPPPERDFPPAPAPTGDAWRAAVEGLDAAYQSLAEATAALDEAQLEIRVPGQEYTARILLHGVVEHGTYHGGQIALLRRALRVSP